METSSATEKQINAGLARIRAIADAIRELRSVPSGELYAHVMGHFDLTEYEKIITILKNAGLVTESSGHMLTWRVA